MTSWHRWPGKRVRSSTAFGRTKLAKLAPSIGAVVLVCSTAAGAQHQKKAGTATVYGASVCDAISAEMGILAAEPMAVASGLIDAAKNGERVAPAMLAAAGTQVIAMLTSSVAGSLRMSNSEGESLDRNGGRDISQETRMNRLLRLNALHAETCVTPDG